MGADRVVSDLVPSRWLVSTVGTWDVDLLGQNVPRLVGEDVREHQWGVVP